MMKRGRFFRIAFLNFVAPEFQEKQGSSGNKNRHFLRNWQRGGLLFPAVLLYDSRIMRCFTGHTVSEKVRIIKNKVHLEENTIVALHGSQKEISLFSEGNIRYSCLTTQLFMVKYTCFIM